MERVEANRVRTGFAERAVKAEGCSCTIVTKHQRARSGDVGIGVAVAALSPIKAPGRVRIAPVSAKTLRTRHMRRSLTCRPASAAWATIGVRLWILFCDETCLPRFSRLEPERSRCSSRQ